MSADRILVTGGAGFIGSRLVRALLERGHPVVVLDSLERPTHRDDLPRGLDPRARFLRGDVRDAGAWRGALDGVGTVCHLAARGGYTEEQASFLESNSVATARLLETIREHRLPVRRILVASSVGVYGEGMGECAEHGRVHPRARPLSRMDRGLFEPVCPVCGANVRPCPSRESDPVEPQRPYSISKYDQERLVLSGAAEIGVDVAALRFFVTYGPGQSLYNPYTGVLSLFAARIAAGRRPVLYEDGLQTRDFIHVDDVVDAHLSLLARDTLGAEVFNVGTGIPTTLAGLARTVASALGAALEPELPGTFRVGDVRHIHADTSALRRLGWKPRLCLGEGVASFLEWFRGQELPGDLFEAAQSRLAARGLIRGVAGA